MTKSEYKEYEKQVESFFVKTGISNLSTICDKDTGYCEPYFSHSPCDCCNGIAGDRYEANGFNPINGEIYEFSVCSDCLYYAEYGKLDDMIMLEME